MQTLSPPADCSVNDMLINAAPFVNQSFFPVVDVTSLANGTFALAKCPRSRSQPD